ncbi:MAG TPA: tetratricopeptide repeat protein [Gemmata sp.]|nr:tetratricopeptide repeat protein [Gemmata sp.]
MNTQISLLTIAVNYHQAGQLREAEKLYREILASEPGNADALHLLGVIAYQVGKHEPAIEHIKNAIRLRGMDAEMCSNLGAAYQALNQLKEAECCYQNALQERPDHISARYNIGNLYLKQRKLDEAIDCYRRVLQLQPDNIGAINNLGQALKGQEDFSGAANCYEKILQLQPGNAEVHINLGTVRDAQKRHNEAIACYRHAIQLRPDLSTGHYNLGNSLKDQGHLSEAIASYHRSLQLAPDHADSHFALGMSSLTVGEWVEGWREYEWRWKTHFFKVPDFAQDRGWDGSDLHGRTIVIHAEQGMGDTIQFVRYLPLVRERGGRIVFQCQDRLTSLLNGVIAADEIVPREQPLPPSDCAVALMSLPGIFNTTPENIPAQIPYLHADPERRARWRNWLDQYPGRKVGICWRGNPKHPDDARRSVKLTAFAQLAKIDGIQLVSLQTSDGLEELAEHAESLNILDAAIVADEKGESFLELAALYSELDLIVTVDTVTCHLAGALGVPAWVALAFMADWRWLQKREDTPWYPSLRLFRQQRPGEWDPVFSSMSEALSNFFESSRNEGGSAVS